MAGNFWQSSHCAQWVLDKIDLSRERAADLAVLSEEEYTKVMIFYCSFIQVLGEQLKLRQQVIASATVFFKRSTPSAAIATFLLLLSRASSGGPDTIAATGLAMLFSAGTFLYVATGGVHGHSSGASGDKHQGGGFSKAEQAMLILGTVAPLFLSITEL